MNIIEELLLLNDDKNAEFQARLAPTITPESCLGVRVPDLRRLEKRIRNTDEVNSFLCDLPHKYYDENLLHSIIISNSKDYMKVMECLDAFLPYVDNWAVCDTLRPTVFKKQKNGLIDRIFEWISSNETYTCRFGIDMLMTFYLDEDYKPEYLSVPASVKSSEYYVNMMIAWFYATALAKHWNDALVHLTDNRLPVWVHNKTIQKARESYKITEEQKKVLNQLKR